MRDCLIQSRNIPTIKLLKSVGIDRTISLAKSLGIDSDLEPNLSLALGASSVTPLEMAKAYSVFANGGNRITQTNLIQQVFDRHGKLLETSDSKLEPVLKPQIAFVMTHLLEEVVKYGTGKGAQLAGRPVAGKTGTTDENHDAWFVGYTPELVTVVWIGYDDASRSLGDKEDGGKIASPIWSHYMNEVLAGTPPTQFKVPSGLTMANVDRRTGKRSYGGISEYFISGTEPKVNSADYLLDDDDDTLATYQNSRTGENEKVSLHDLPVLPAAPEPEKKTEKLNQSFFLEQ